MLHTHTMPQVTHHNHGPETLKVASNTIAHGRQLRLQPLNNYRKMFHLEPHKSFEEMTGERS